MTETTDRRDEHALTDAELLARVRELIREAEAEAEAEAGGSEAHP